MRRPTRAASGYWRTPFWGRPLRRLCHGLRPKEGRGVRPDGGVIGVPLRPCRSGAIPAGWRMGRRGGRRAAARAGGWGQHTGLAGGLGGPEPVHPVWGRRQGHGI